MDTTTIFVTVEEGARVPEYHSNGAAGMDLRAFLPEPITLRAGSRALIPTGLRLQLPDGYEAQVRPRSGLAFQHGITCLNSPGTIDSDYRGELCVLLVNLGDEPFTVRNGDRVAQLVVAPYTKATIDVKSDIVATNRGSGGFGSTGID
jgi:dUTP pyrophosphatase